MLSGYPFTPTTSKIPQDRPGVKKVFYFHFTGKNNCTYIAEVEEYDYFVFVIKFYLKQHRLSDHKYKLITNNRDIWRIVITCIDILMWIRQKYPLASFGFIGANTFDPDHPDRQEAINNTQRFIVYRYLVSSYISEDYFNHLKNIDYSGYLLISKNNPDPYLSEKIDKLFKKFYVDRLQDDLQTGALAFSAF